MYKISLVFWRMRELGILLSKFTDLYWFQSFMYVLNSTTFWGKGRGETFQGNIVDKVENLLKILKSNLSRTVAC